MHLFLLTARVPFLFAGGGGFQVNDDFANILRATARAQKQKRGAELYRHFDASGRLLYVGIARDTMVRLGSHRLQSSWYDRVARVEIERFPTRSAALKAEAKAIRTENPECNVMRPAVRKPQKPKKPKKCQCYTCRKDRSAGIPERLAA
jgi:hypothetical protein